MDNTKHQIEEKEINPVDSDSKLPILTIITVVWNAEDSIEDTILSVVNQDYSNIEYIIIDGCSSDNTLEIISRYEDKIRKWISEPDNGIYDAMNRGISLAKGDWVNFMNAGDRFHDNQTCSMIADHVNSKDCDAVYGDYIAIDNEQKSQKIIKAKSLNKLKRGMVFSHQSVFIKRNLLEDFPFDLGFRISADYNQILKLYLNKRTFCYLPSIISYTSIDGLSYSNIKTTIEKIRIIRSINPWSIGLVFSFAEYFVAILRKLLGEKLVNIIRGIKWKLFK